MSLKSRLLRIALILIGVLLFAGYFAFTTFLYNPFEGALDADVAALVPRDVDFFVAKAELGSSFTKFPRLKVQDKLDKHPAWQAWAASPECQKLAADLDLEKSLAALDQNLKQIPLGMGPLDLFGGKDLALAGYFHGSDFAQSDWAAYGRLNWAGRLGSALLAYPGMLGLDKRGIKVRVEPKYIALSGGGLPRELFLTRLKDVLVIATKAELATAAVDLAAKRFEDSFFQSANYNDWIGNASRDAARDEFEVYLNVRKLLENLALKGPLPDPKSQEFATALAGRLFQLPSLKNSIGVAGVDGGVALDLHGELSSELVMPELQRLYRTRGFDRNMLALDVSKLAPRDTAIFLYMHAKIGDVLRALLGASEPALRDNLDTAFRNTGRYPNLDALVNELDAAFKDRVALIVRPNDYPPDADGPPHNDTPVPAVALVLWTQNQDTVDKFRDLVGAQGVRFRMEGKNKNEAGYYKYSEAGYETFEYWSPLVPGTGVIVTAKVGELTVVTNSLGMIRNIIKTYSQGGEKYPQLADEPRFSALVQSSLTRANLALWVNPKTLTPLLRALGRRVAEDSIVIDAKSLRPLEETRVLKDEFGGRKVDGLDESEKQKLSDLVDERFSKMRRQVKEEQVPMILAKQERLFTYLEASSGLLALLALDPKAIDLSLRLVTPLEPK